jgi:hypothetical protein
MGPETGRERRRAAGEMRDDGGRCDRGRGSMRAVTVALLLLLLLTRAAAGATTAGMTIGVVPNEKFVYSYTIFTTFETPNGNQSSTEDNTFTLGVLSTGDAEGVGAVAYSETITEVNGTYASTPSAIENTTAVFDPYNNETYLGNIGFYPFTYTDLGAGSAEDLPVSLTITGTPEGDVTGAQQVNATVARASGVIDVNFTIFTSAGTPPSLTVMRYNATNGVLIQGTTYTNFFSTEKNFIYELVSSTRAPTGIFNTDVQVFIVSGLIVVVAVVAVWRITSTREKGRKKFASARRKRGRASWYESHADGGGCGGDRVGR